jgi:hypothetical protein
MCCVLFCALFAGNHFDILFFSPSTTILPITKSSSFFISPLSSICLVCSNFSLCPVEFIHTHIFCLKCVILSSLLFGSFLFFSFLSFLFFSFLSFLFSSLKLWSHIDTSNTLVNTFAFLIYIMTILLLSVQIYRSCVRHACS